MRTVAIAGVGLIGGSFALALRQAGFDGRILGVSSPATTKEALARGVIDEAVSLEDAASRADLIYLAQPVLAIIDALPKVASHLKPGALVTDAGSTKAQIVAAANACLPPSSFIGGHPMAGKEQRGLAAADASLFKDRPYVLTPGAPAHLESPAAAALVGWLRQIGVRLVTLEPATHDRMVAAVSHVPQLLSTALAASLACTEGTRQVAGPAILDMTRLALSDYDLWRDILVTNATEIRAGLALIIDKLQYLQGNLTDAAVRDLFSQGQIIASQLRENR